ncbi:hypothetical protein [Kordia sp.]|uniref:hypothetical protein n=1 Tax=Kordia sp. TaxID=1965332 RepID=UPI003D287851
MHRGEVAYVHTNYVRVPKHLLHPLNLVDSSRLTGLYYPTPRYYKDKEFVENITHDFIFSPIPFDLWPFLGRMTIRAKEDIGTLASIANVLEEEGINILISDAHKAGHRYMVWSLIVEFNEISTSYYRKKLYSREACNKTGDFKKEANMSKYERLEKIINKVISKKIKELKIIITEKCKEVLFDFNSEKDRQDKKKRITIVKAKTLPYHYWEVKKDRDKHNERIPFDTKIKNNKILFDSELSNKIKKKVGLCKESPVTLGFVNVHTNASRLRISIVRASDLPSYKKIIINYKIKGKEDNCKGLIAKIAKGISSENINIQNVTNKILGYKKYNEEGMIEMIVKLDENLISTDSLEKKLQFLLKKNNSKVSVFPINNYKIFVSIVSSFFFRKQFINMLKKIGEKYALPKDCFVFVQENISETTNKVISELKDCDGMIQFFINFSNKADLRWLDSEYFSARSLDIPVIRIQDELQEIESVIARDNHSVYINLNDSKKEMQKKINHALGRLIELMREKTKTHFQGI